MRPWLISAKVQNNLFYLSIWPKRRNFEMAATLKCWREAATLILVAKNGQQIVSKGLGGKNPNSALFNYDVLMLKRSSKSKFMPSLYVFPGGIADDSDFAKEWRDIFKVQDIDKTFDLVKRGGKGPPMFSRERSTEYEFIPSELAFRICAIRETFEESGVLLARRPSEISDDFSSKPILGCVADLPESVIQPWRERIDKDSSQFLKMCKELDIIPDVWSLSEWSNWLTPTIMRTTGHKKQKGRRYDTAFFFCELDSIPKAVQDDGEMVHAQWSTPDGLIKSYVNNNGGLAPPQVYEICRLMNFQDAGELLNFNWQRSSTKRVVRWFPVVVTCSNGVLYTYPGDELYPEYPDFEGNNPPTALEETVTEANIKYPKMNRMAVEFGEKPVSKDEGKKDGQLLVTVQMLDGQKMPVQDLSFIGLPRARL